MVRALIEGRKPTSPFYGLLVAAETITDGDPRWALGGATWESEVVSEDMAGQSGLVAMRDCDAAGNPGAGATSWVRQQSPVLVWTVDKCSTLGSADRDFQGRATRALEAVQSFQIARELWEGNAASAQPDAGLDTPGSTWFLDPDLLTYATSGSAVSVVAGLSCVEQHLAETLEGQRGMVHVTVGVLTALLAEQAIWRDGTLWRTANGHVVVADAGYTGNGGAGGNGGDAGASQFIIGTDMLSVRLGPILVTPDSVADATDHRINDVLFTAQRPALVVWDALVSVAAEVSVAHCNPVT